MQTNFGRQEELMILGAPIGQHVVGDRPTSAGDDGSVMIVIATDAPLTSRQLGRLAHRVAFGLGRTGTICHHGSGDFVVAFSTAGHDGAQSDHHLSMLNGLFQGVVEGVEESVYNALMAARTTTGYRGHTLHALPSEQVRHWLEHYKRLN